MIQHNPIGFLFDLDGVLIDSEREYSKIWARVNQEFPSGITSLESVIKGCTLDKILDDHYPDFAVREMVVKRLYELEALMKYEYLPGADALLENIREYGCRTALVTSSNDVKMAHLDEELPELRGRFDFIVTADLITKSKPDPEGYLLAADEIGCRPEYCVVFEDSLQGVKAGHNSGAYVVGVAGTLPAETLAPYADIVVDSLEKISVSELIDSIKSKNEQ